jgi:LAO/AO transport system kinase
MLSGGSLLGDRIRLSQSEIPKNVFIRSLSTRSTQAFSPAVRDMEVYLESLFDEVWVETAGSGQTQQEVTQISGLSILILQPETGDEIQWMKSGVRELADLFVVHKCDLPGASTMMQSLIENGVSSENILLVSSKTGAGLQELMDLIERKRTNTTWKSKLQAIHLAHARALFLEKALSRELKKFEKVKRAWANKPYR